MPVKNTFSGKPFALSGSVYWPNRETDTAVMGGTPGTNAVTYATDRKASHAVSNPRFIFANYAQQSGNTADNTTLPNITIHCSVEYPIGGGTRHELTFNGAAQPTLACRDWWESDAVTGLTIPAGATYRIFACIVSVSGGDGSAWGNGAPDPWTVTNYYMQGDHALDGDISGNQLLHQDVFQPIACTGDVAGLHKSAGICGDSVGQGASDGTHTVNGCFDADGQAVDTVSVGGAWMRSVVPTGKVVMQLSASGAVISDHANSLIRLPLMTHCDFVIGEVQVNDFRNGHSAATVRADVTSLVAAIRANGNVVHWCTSTPITSSTDSWATTANQTDLSTGGAVATYNAALLASAPSGISHVYDTGNAAMSATGSAKWFVDGTANKATADGVHPSPFAHDLILAAIDTSQFPLSATAATAYTITCPGLIIGRAGSVTLRAGTGTVFAGTESIAVAISPDGSPTSATVTPTRDAATALLSYTAATTGIKTITGTATGLTDPASPAHVAAVGPTNHQSAILADSPAVYYPMAETSGTTMTDLSGNGRDGTYTASGLTYSATGPARDGKTAITFDGSTGQGQGPVGSWGNVTSFTVASWYKPNNILGGHSGGFVYRYDPGTGQWDWVFRVRNGKVEFQQGPGIALIQTTANTYADNAWHLAHVTLSYNSGTDTTTVAIYVDGVLAGSGSFSGPTTHTCPTFFIGGQDADLAAMKGSLADFAFFPSVLSATRIAAQYVAAVGLMTADVGQLTVGQATPIALTGVNTATLWTAGTPGTPTFNGSNLSVGAQSITDGTGATATVTAASTGLATLTDSSAGVTVGFYASPPTSSLTTTETTLERGQAGQTIHVVGTGTTWTSSAGSGGATADWTLGVGTVTAVAVVDNTHATLTVTAQASTGTGTGVTYVPGSITGPTITVSDTTAPNSPTLGSTSVIAYTVSLPFTMPSASPTGETVRGHAKKNGSTVASNLQNSDSPYVFSGVVDGDVLGIDAYDDSGNTSSATTMTFHPPATGTRAFAL